MMIPDLQIVPIDPIRSHQEIKAIKFTKLPEEIILKIFTFLPIKEVSYLGSLCSKLHRISKDVNSILKILPEEILVKIFTFLPIKDVICFGSLCTQLKKISENRLIWENFYEKIKVFYIHNQIEKISTKNEMIISLSP